MRVRLPGLGPVHCQSRAYTRFAHAEIFRNSQYARHGIRLRPGDVVFDVGANIGLFSLFAHQQCHGDLTLHAFEPIPDTFQLLQRNTHHIDRVHLHPCGLTAPGRSSAEFAFYPGSSGLSTMKQAEMEAIVTSTPADTVVRTIRASSPALFWLGLPLYPIRGPLVRAIRRRRLRATTMTCKLRTLSEVWRQHDLERIDLLKIDVEGSELDVLDGIEDAHWPAVEQLVIEVHDLDGRLKQLMDRLTDRGFRVTAEVQDWSTDSMASTYMVYARRE